MAVEGPGEERGPAGRRREELHQLRLPGERRHGPAVAHRLAHRGQVGRHAADRLVAAERVPPAGDHLVEDQHGPVLGRELAQPLEEAGLRQQRADVVRDRLEDDRGDVVLGQRALDLVGVVELADDRRLDDLGDRALRERIAAADVLGQRDHVHRDRVVPAVVAALELDQVAPAGGGARDTHRVEGRLAPGLGEQHALGRGDEVADPLGELDLDRASRRPPSGRPCARSRRRRRRRRGRCGRGAAARRRRGSRCRCGRSPSVKVEPLVAVTTMSSRPGTRRWPLFTPPGITRTARSASPAACLVLSSMLAMLSLLS